MSEINFLNEIEEVKLYSPILILNEDLASDNRFCVIKTQEGNIAISYYDIGLKPSALEYNHIIFLGFGKRYYVIDLKASSVLYQSEEALSVIYETIICAPQKCVVAVGEFSIMCFGLNGKLLWKNTYRHVLYDWEIHDDKLIVTFENNEIWRISLDTGNGVPVK